MFLDEKKYIFCFFYKKKGRGSVILNGNLTIQNNTGETIHNQWLQHTGIF